MGTGTLLLLLGAAYLVMKGMGTPAESSIIPVGVPTPPTTPPPAPMTVAAALAALTSTIQAGGEKQTGGDYHLTPWQFNYYLASATGINLDTALASQGGLGKLFPGCSTGVQGGCDTTPISLTQFWSVASVWLKGNGSLSGIGKFPNLLGGNRVRMPKQILGGWR